MTRPPLVAVVFDCDGTLVDSEPIAWEAWTVVLAPRGVQVREEDVRACTGRTFRDTYGHFAARAALPPPQAVREQLEEELERRYPAELQAFPDALEVLEAAEGAQLRLAVASSSPRRRLDLALRTTGLAGRFPIQVAGDEVAQGKPAPDLFAAAVRDLEVAPGSAVAIEDTAPGVASARRAGLRVVGVQREPHADLGAADRVVTTLVPSQVLRW